MSTRWHYRISGRDLGPVDFATLQQMANEERLFFNDEIRPEDSDEWVQAETVPGLFPESADVDDLDSMLSGGDTASAPAGPDACYCRTRSEELGPMSFAKLVSLARTGRLGRRDQVRIGAQSNWVEARSVQGLFEDIKQSAPEPGRAAAALDGLEIVSDPTPRRPRAPLTEPAPAIRMDDDVVPVGAGDAANELSEWHCRVLGQEIGPIPWSDLRELVETRQLGPNDRVRKGESVAWVPAATIDGLFPKRPKRPKRKQKLSEEEAFDFLQSDEPEDTVSSHVAPQRNFSRAPRETHPTAVEHREAESESARPIPREPVSAATPRPTPRPAAVTPASARAAAPPPRPARPKREPRPMRNPFSGLGAGIGGLFGAVGSGMSSAWKPLAAVAAVLLVGGGIFGLVPLLSGESGKSFYVETEQIWNKAQEIKKANQTAEWKKFAGRAMEDSMAIRGQLNQLDTSGNRMLELLMLCHKECLPKILAGSLKDEAAAWSEMEQYMSEAKQLSASL